jgi:hypothetical protein
MEWNVMLGHSVPSEAWEQAIQTLHQTVIIATCQEHLKRLKGSRYVNARWQIPRHRKQERMAG